MSKMLHRVVHWTVIRDAQTAMADQQKKRKFMEVMGPVPREKQSHQTYQCRFALAHSGNHLQQIHIITKRKQISVNNRTKVSRATSQRRRQTHHNLGNSIHAPQPRSHHRTEQTCIGLSEIHRNWKKRGTEKISK